MHVHLDKPCKPGKTSRKQTDLPLFVCFESLWFWQCPTVDSVFGQGVKQSLSLRFSWLFLEVVYGSSYVEKALGYFRNQKMFSFVIFVVIKKESFSDARCVYGWVVKMISALWCFFRDELKTDGGPRGFCVLGVLVSWSVELTGRDVEARWSEGWVERLVRFCFWCFNPRPEERVWFEESGRLNKNGN